jgi:hypothetical protein
MPKVSRETASPIDQGGTGTEWRGELDGYTTSFVHVAQDADLTPLFEGLPNDQCPSPHWGYVTKGSTWWRYGDREEVVSAGEAFYAAPGHTSGAWAGAEFVIFSPTEIMDEVEAHMEKRALELLFARG